eukprot:2409845-Rhodomonas_salina.3
MGPEHRPLHQAARGFVLQTAAVMQTDGKHEARRCIRRRSERRGIASEPLTGEVLLCRLKLVATSLRCAVSRPAGRRWNGGRGFHRSTRHLACLSQRA